VYHLLLPDQVPGPALTTSELADQVRKSAAPGIVASVIGDGPGASEAQHAVTAALRKAVGLPLSDTAPQIAPDVNIAPGSPVYTAAVRFAELPVSVRHAWLVRHLGALRAGQIALAQLP